MKNEKLYMPVLSVRLLSRAVSTFRITITYLHRICLFNDVAVDDNTDCLILV